MPNNINPFQMLMGAMGQQGNGNSRNPMQALMGQFGNNPLFSRAQQMAQGKSPQEIEQIARNLCQQKGVDFDQAKAQFQKQFKF